MLCKVFTQDSPYKAPIQIKHLRRLFYLSSDVSIVLDVGLATIPLGRESYSLRFVEWAITLGTQTIEVVTDADKF